MKKVQFELSTGRVELAGQLQRRVTEGSLVDQDINQTYAKHCTTMSEDLFQFTFELVRANPAGGEDVSDAQFLYDRGVAGLVRPAEVEVGVQHAGQPGDGAAL